MYGFEQPRLQQVILAMQMKVPRSLMARYRLRLYPEWSGAQFRIQFRWAKPRAASYGDSIEQLRSFERLIDVVLWDSDAILTEVFWTRADIWRAPLSKWTLIPQEKHAPTEVRWKNVCKLQISFVDDIFAGFIDLISFVIILTAILNLDLQAEFLK